MIRNEPEVMDEKDLLRSPPAFQWYASDIMASEVFMLASLKERGLFVSMLNYCWVNRSITADYRQIARLLNLDEEEVGLCSGVLIHEHFKSLEGDAERLYAPELERQRQQMQARRQGHVRGGRKGGRRTQSNKRALSIVSVVPSRSAKASEKRGNEMTRTGPEASRVRVGREDLNGDELLDKCDDETGTEQW